MGGDRARRLLRARQPDRDHRRQPARPARRDDARLGPRLVLATGCARSAGTRSRSTATTSSRSTRAYREAAATTGAADRDRREDDQGQGVLEGRGHRTAGTARRVADGGRRRSSAAIRNVTRRRARSRRRGEPHRFEPAPRSSGRATRSARRSRRGRRTARRSRRSAASAADVVALDGEVSNSTYAEIFREGASRAVLRDVHRRAADGRRGGRDAGARLEAVRVDVRRVHDAARTTSSAWRRSRARTSGCAARTRASRSARTARRRWRSRTSPRSAPSTARPCSTPATATRRRSSSRAMADLDGISFLRTTRADTPVIYEPDEEFPVGGSKVVRDADDDDVAIVAAGITVHEALEAADDARRRGDLRARDRPATRSSRSTRRRCARLPRRPGPIVTVEDHWPEGGLGEAVLSALADLEERRASSSSRVRELPRSGKPAELLAAAGIDAERIAEAARAPRARARDRVVSRRPRRARHSRSSASPSSRARSTSRRRRASRARARPRGPRTRVRPRPTSAYGIAGSTSVTASHGDRADPAVDARLRVAPAVRGERPGARGHPPAFGVVGVGRDRPRVVAVASGVRGRPAVAAVDAEGRAAAAGFVRAPGLALVPDDRVHVALRARPVVGPRLAAVGRAHQAAELDPDEQQRGVVRAGRDPAHVRRPRPRRETPRRPRRELEQRVERAPGRAAVVAAEEAARLAARVDGAVDRADRDREARPRSGSSTVAPRRAAVGRLPEAALAQPGVRRVRIARDHGESTARRCRRASSATVQRAPSSSSPRPRLPGGGPEPHAHYPTRMAVVIASNLRKELARRRCSSTASRSRSSAATASRSPGPNGAGKTTLLRMLAGETEVHGGELAFQKGTRVALHDQRPPLERELTLREYVLSGAADLVATRGRSCAGSSRRWRAATHDAATLRRYARGAGAARARGRLRLARPARRRRCAGSASADADLDRPLTTFSGGELTRASLARALGGDPDLLLLDEPTNHLDVASLEWLEQELAVARRRPIILVAHDRWFLEAVTNATLELEAGRSTFFAGPVARVAAREGRARGARAEDGRPDRGRHRAPRALRRALPLQEDQGEAGAGEADADRAARAGALDRRPDEVALLAPPHAHARLRVPQAARGAAGPSSRPRASRSRAGDKHLLLERRRSRSSAASTSRSSGRTARARRRCSRRCSAAASPRRARSRLGHGVEPAYFSQQEVELDDRGTVLECAQAATGLQRPQAQTLLGRFLFSGWDAHEKAVTVLSGGERRRLALALVVALGRELPRPRRADEPPRPREPRGARGGARGVPGHGAARLARPRAARRGRRADARDRGRARSTRTTAAGPTTSERGRSERPRRRRRRGREAEAARAKPSAERRRATRPTRARAARGRDRRPRGRGRRARAAARRGLDGRRRARRRTAARATTCRRCCALGGAVREVAGVSRSGARPRVSSGSSWQEASREQSPSGRARTRAGRERPALDRDTCSTSPARSSSGSRSSPARRPRRESWPGRRRSAQLDRAMDEQRGVKRNPEPALPRGDGTVRERARARSSSPEGFCSALGILSAQL